MGQHLLGPQGSAWFSPLEYKATPLRTATNGIGREPWEKPTGWICPVAIMIYIYLVLICTVIANALDEYNIIWSYVYIYIYYMYVYIYILYVHIHPAGIYMHIWSMIHVQTQRAILPSQKSLWRNFEMCHKDHNMHHIYTWKCLRIEFVMHSANLLIVPIRYF
jgi:Ca2+/Na+ antiporter